MIGLLSKTMALEKKQLLMLFPNLSISSNQSGSNTDEHITDSTGGQQKAAPKGIFGLRDKQLCQVVMLNSVF